MVTPKVYADSGFSNDGGPRTDFLIKASFTSDAHYRKNMEIHLPNAGKLSYSFIDQYSFNLTWGMPLLADLANRAVALNTNDVIYHVIVTNELRARLDTVCALRREIINDYQYTVYETNETFLLFKNGVPGERYLMNVIVQINGLLDNGEPELVPYLPIEM